MSKFRWILIFIVGCLVLPLNLYGGGGHDHGHGHDHLHEEDKGVHDGKLFKKEDFAIEVTIFEDGVPPQFRLYASYKGKELEPNDYKAKIELLRFGDIREVFEFRAAEGFVTSEKTVEEPHSFAVQLYAEHAGKSYQWHYDSFEGRTELSEDALKVANISIEEAAPQKLISRFKVYGRLIPNENKVAHLSARFPGIIKQITKQLGDSVTKGDLLAVIESNQSLQNYEIRSLIDGKVIKRHATIGEFVPDSREIFVIADLSEIWADFQVYRDDFGPIIEGQEVEIDLGNNSELIKAKISYVSPLADISTQSKLIRAVLPNADGKLRPGLFVSAILSSPDSEVPVAVTRDAIQTFRDWDVVYLASSNGSIFQAMPVELGRKDSRYVEVLSGIEKGDRYVAKNSFVIKADIEKSGASHDH